MAMLKALSDHVSHVFAAGDRMEDIQCKMITNAIDVQQQIGHSKVAREAARKKEEELKGLSIYSQRLQNPYRSSPTAPTITK